MRLLSILTVAGLFVGLSGCEDRTAPRERKVAEDTEIKDELFGGTEVKKKEVIEKENGQYEVRERETDLDEHGNVTEQETKVKKPDEGVDVDVRGDEGGVSVDIKTPDRD